MEQWANGDAPFDHLPKIVGGRYGLSSKRIHAGDDQGHFDGLSADKPKITLQSASLMM